MHMASLKDKTHADIPIWFIYDRFLTILKYEKEISLRQLQINVVIMSLTIAERSVH